MTIDEEIEAAMEEEQALYRAHIKSVTAAGMTDDELRDLPKERSSTA